MAESVAKFIAFIIFVLGLSVIPVLLVFAYLIGAVTKKAEISFVDRIIERLPKKQKEKDQV